MSEAEVTIICIAYNHEKYITDAIEGFLKQKTEFPVKIIIHDDASTDRTVDIISEYKEKYPDKIECILQTENQYSKPNNILFNILFPLVQTKYVAICEGDDYWIDEFKLQKQIDYLEKHQECSAYMHNAIKLDTQTGNQQLMNTWDKSGIYSQEEQIKMGLGSSFSAFASLVFRTDLIKDIPFFFTYVIGQDYTVRQYLACCGYIYYDEKPMSVYRVNVSQSAMAKMKNDDVFYNDSLIYTIGFFEQFDIYTKEKFHSILWKKIVSDYMGFCCSINKEEGLQKAESHRLDRNIVERCYSLIDEKNCSEDLLMQLQNGANVYIYGTSRLAHICMKQLEQKEQDIKGFVVSYQTDENQTFCGKKVWSIEELVKTEKDIVFVLAVQPINIDAIETVIKQYGSYKIVKPYSL